MRTESAIPHATSWPWPWGTAGLLTGLLMGAALAGCRPSDVLSVPAPVGVLPASAISSQSGAEQLELNGLSLVSQGFGGAYSGVLEWSGLLSDEFTWTDVTYSGAYANIDARFTTATGGFRESGDEPIDTLMVARLTLLSALGGLEKYEPASGRPKIGEAFALIGYIELLIAEDYCSGLPLAQQTAAGLQYGTPLTTDSLLGTAEADFDSAAVYANGDPTMGPLASIGLARTLLDRGQYAAAGAGLSAVPTSYVYNTELEGGGYSSGAPYAFNIYDYYAQYEGCTEANTPDQKGTNGLPYISAADPRLVFSTTVGETCDGLYGGAADSVWYYPTKFGNPSIYIPLATGVEARLIEAEAALQAGDVTDWTTDLNTLRADAPGTYLALASAVPPLTPDSTTTATTAMQVDVMFRERGFWLYGMGLRLGDMRRLVRQYGRDQSTVFPVGPYPNAGATTLPAPLPTYGTDVNMTLPTVAGGATDPNPKYKGCLTSTKVA